jgi:hypothetical protein
MNVDFQRYRIDWRMTKFNFEILCRFIESGMSCDWNDPEILDLQLHRVHFGCGNSVLVICLVSPRFAGHQDTFRSSAGSRTSCTFRSVVQIKNLPVISN